MKPSTVNRIYDLARKNNGYLVTEELAKYHIARSHLKTMMEEGWLTRVKRGLYRLADVEPESYDTFVDLRRAIPKGVICFHSAMEFFELSMINSSKVHVAVSRKTRVTLPEYPPVELHYIPDWYFTKGITEVMIRNETVHIYTPEKTLCDCIRYRDKIGTDLAIEAFKTYIKIFGGKKLELLMRMAMECKVEDKVRSYMEVLV